jgi:hypothetical protein
MSPTNTLSIIQHVGVFKHAKNKLLWVFQLSITFLPVLSSSYMPLFFLLFLSFVHKDTQTDSMVYLKTVVNEKGTLNLFCDTSIGVQIFNHRGL